MLFEELRCSVFGRGCSKEDVLNNLRLKCDVVLDVLSDLDAVGCLEFKWRRVVVLVVLLDAMAGVEKRVSI